MVYFTERIQKKVHLKHVATMCKKKIDSLSTNQFNSNNDNIDVSNDNSITTTSLRGVRKVMPLLK